MGDVSPVRRFQISTRETAETEAFVRQMYVGNRSEFVNPGRCARFSATVATTQDITATEVDITAGYRAQADPFDYYCFFLLTHGRAQITTGRDRRLVAAGETSFYPVGVPLEVGLLEQGGQRSLHLPVARLGTVAEQTAGIRAADLRFLSTTPVSPAMARQWSSTIDLAVSMLLAEDAPAVSPLVADGLIRTATLTALHTFPNTAMSVSYQPGPAWVAPAAVRRAAAFIQAHADEPITLGQIAAAAGVSGRALRHAFRRHFDLTPMQYLRRVRLERADEDLRAADPAGGLTVAEVARRWGWAGQGRFIEAYRRRFGVSPSETLGT